MFEFCTYSATKIHIIYLNRYMLLQKIINIVNKWIK